jgi:hypothetical protein
MNNDGIKFLDGKEKRGRRERGEKEEKNFLPKPRERKKSGK